MAEMLFDLISLVTTLVFVQVVVTLPLKDSFSKSYVSWLTRWVAANPGSDKCVC